VVVEDEEMVYSDFITEIRTGFSARMCKECQHCSVSPEDYCKVCAGPKWASVIGVELEVTRIQEQDGGNKDLEC
jgi:hypothetical protein